MTAVVPPLEVTRYPAGDRHNMPFLVSVVCPFCGEVHTHSVSVRALGNRFAWKCSDSLIRQGSYRLAVFPTLGAMWTALDTYHERTSS